MEEVDMNRSLQNLTRESNPGRTGRLSSVILLLAFLTLSFGWQSAAAQTINGVVRDAKSNDVLIGANVVQVGTQHGVSTGDNGRFELSLIDDGRTAIKVTYVGYKEKVVDVNGRRDGLDIYLVPTSLMGSEVFVEALRVDESTPMAYSNLSEEQLAEENTGQDVPYLLRSLPSVTTTSDAGAGIGYTGIRIRGVDPARINVTINGVPLNDAESHGVFWVNLPDLASSVENIQVQRGVGTSTNGAGAFGGSLNLQTGKLEPNPYGAAHISVGSYNTQKYNVQFGSGLMDNGWQIDGRLSKITSDGYIDRASSDLKSFYLSAAYHGENSLLKADVFSGREETYHAWWGISEQQLQQDRTYNPAGTEKPGDPYEDQTDNYQQDHYQLHYNYQFSKQWDANVSLHFTKGRGYYEEYNGDESLSDYGMTPITVNGSLITNSDLVTQKWLDNEFYGGVFSSTYNSGNQLKLTVGGAYNQYYGDHFGKVIWSEYGLDQQINDRYYNNDAYKRDMNLYTKLRYRFTDAWSGFVDLQARSIHYEFLGNDFQVETNGDRTLVNTEQDDDLLFFNPKAGVVYQDETIGRLFASVSVANKEPTRDEYVDSTPESRPSAETLYDGELGWKKDWRRGYVGINTYLMYYRDQLILTGEINDVGAYVRRNVPESYRAGIELQGSYRVMKGLELAGNMTLSQNKITEYTKYIDDYDNGGQLERTFENTDIAFSPSIIANGIANYRWNGFDFQWTTKYVGRQYLDNTQSESRSLDPYLVSDAQVEYTWDQAPIFKTMRFNLQVNNIFSEKYESNGYTYGYISGGSEQHYNYYYPQATRNFMLQVSLEF
jgi:iron complex outermembrane receptor protein